MLNILPIELKMNSLHYVDLSILKEDIVSEANATNAFAINLTKQQIFLV